jgi:FeS assembly SUF system regulator
MLRLPKLTDYAVVLLTNMAQTPNAALQTTGDLATRTGLAAPTVAKILKQLTKQGLLTAQRGTHGGYRLARPPAEITVADIVVALDGPVAVTDCVNDQHGHCGVERLCTMRGQWDTINRAIKSALAVTLADMSSTPSGLPPRAVTAEPAQAAL